MKSFFLFVLVCVFNAGNAVAQSPWLFSADASVQAVSNSDLDGSGYDNLGVARLTRASGAFSVQYRLPHRLGFAGVALGHDIRYQRIARINDQPASGISDRYDVFIGPQYHYFFGAPTLSEARWLAGFRYGFFLDQTLFESDLDAQLKDTKYLLTVEAGHVLKARKRGALTAVAFFESRPLAIELPTPNGIVAVRSRVDRAAGVRLRFFFTGKP